MEKRQHWEIRIRGEEVTKRLGRVETIRLLLQGQYLIFMKGLYTHFCMSNTFDTVPPKVALSLIDEGFIKVSEENWKSITYIFNSELRK